jgi:hypothetical protein
VTGATALTPIRKAWTTTTVTADDHNHHQLCVPPGLGGGGTLGLGRASVRAWCRGERAGAGADPAGERGRRPWCVECMREAGERFSGCERGGYPAAAGADVTLGVARAAALRG